MTELSESKRRLHIFRKDRLAVIGVIVVLLTTLIAIAAPLLAPFNPVEQHIIHRFSPPSSRFVMGTDEFGRDVLSRIIYGSRASLMVGILSIIFSSIIGTFLGVVAGFVGGTIDSVISRVVDVLMSFPSLLLGLMVVVILGPGLTNVIIAIGLSKLPHFIRLARGPTLALREKEFITSALALGIPKYRIIWVHLIPNILGPISVMSTLWVATAIRIEASLSFLGLGVQPPIPSWGNMIKTGVDNILSSPWLAVYPGLAITIVVLAFNMLGDGLRDALDPRHQL